MIKWYEIGDIVILKDSSLYLNKKATIIEVQVECGCYPQYRLRFLNGSVFSWVNEDEILAKIIDRDNIDIKERVEFT